MSPWLTCGFAEGMAAGLLRTWVGWVWVGRFIIFELSPCICAVVVYTLWREEKK